MKRPRRTRHVSETFLGKNHFPTDPPFQSVVRQAELAIKLGIHPEPIVEGTSGSYFVLNADKGYLSEAGASLVDEMLKLNVVPRTRVVELASQVFSYRKSERKKPRLPSKPGSFQLFVKDYQDSGYWLRQWGAYGLPKTVELSRRSGEEFICLMQKMIVVDYIIRNTDRKDDNWLIRYESESEPKAKNTRNNFPEKVPTSAESSKKPINKRVGKPETDAEEKETKSWNDKVLVAVIDNGLAFPFKHPDEWRTYPFYWVGIKPFSSMPFVEEIKRLVLRKISNPNFVQCMCLELRKIFKIDAAYQRSVFGRQMAVMRGQMYNLKVVLERDMSPVQLASLSQKLVVPKMKYRLGRKGLRKRRFPEICTWEKVYRIKEVEQRPCFSFM